MTTPSPIDTVDFERISHVPDYRRFKKLVRSLRDQGLFIEPNGDQSYTVSDVDGHTHTVRWAYAEPEAPKVEGEEKPEKAPRAKKAKAVAAGSEEPAKAKKSKKSVANGLMGRGEALATLQLQNLTPLVVNPPTGQTYQAQGWDVITLMSAGAYNLAETMLAAYQYQFPTATVDNTRFVLFRDSPSGTPLSQPIIAIDFVDEAAFTSARQAVDSLSGLQA